MDPYRKPYCTQNNGNCPTCSLVNYGRDCMNYPVGGERKMTKEKLLEIIREMVAENWANSDLDARTEKVLTFIAENDYEGRDEDLEAFADRINAARTETPTLFVVQDALYYSGWNFEKAM